MMEVSGGGVLARPWLFIGKQASAAGTTKDRETSRTTHRLRRRHQGGERDARMAIDSITNG